MTMQVLHNQQTSLTREQKQAVGLLSIGTFLEYFDLMLYVHMAVLLNDLFFPKTDPFTASLISAFAFCSTYIMRPFGALLFGYIGDNIGRKHTVVITTLMMAISCIIMANLPTYEKIGITASWIVTICRMMQGISSIGEITGSQLYLTEITQPPMQYPVVAAVFVCATLGSVVALGVAALCSSNHFNWRWAFWVGAVIALVGTYARSALRETPEFANAKLRIEKLFEVAKKDPKLLETNTLFNEKVSKKKSLALFLIDCSKPVFFYITYIHFGHFLKTTFAFSGSQVIYHNFIVGITYLATIIIQLYLCYYIHPLKILKSRFIVCCIFLASFPYLLSNITGPSDVMFIQMCFMILAPSNYPVSSVLFVHFPIFKRFTYTSIVHAVSHTAIYFVTSFGLIYLIKYFGQIGILFIVIPTCIGFAFGLDYFLKLEKESWSYYKKAPKNIYELKNS